MTRPKNLAWIVTAVAAALVAALAPGCRRDKAAKPKKHGHKKKVEVVREAGPLPPVFPEAAWQRATLSAADMSEAPLTELTEWLRGSGFVTRDGWQVSSWGSPRSTTDVASAAKPVYSWLLIKTIETGGLTSVDAPVSAAEPGLLTLNAALGNKDRTLTWRHLATQTSCYGTSEAPGTAFDYSDFQTALFWDSLFTKVHTGDAATATERVLKPLLTNVLHCQDDPSFTPPGVEMRLGRLLISPRDFCRFGLLMMRHGQWAGRPLLSEEWSNRLVSDPLPASLPRTAGIASEMLPDQRSIGGDANQDDHLGSYSWMWWINGVDAAGRRLWPDAPTDAYGGFGYGGMRALVVIPSLRIVAAWTKTSLPPVPMSGEGRVHMNRAVSLLARAAAGR